MKNTLLTFLIISITQLPVLSQVSNIGLISQEYSKEISEYSTKEYIVRDILCIPEGTLFGVEIDAITASNSGELTTVTYDCETLSKKGIVLTFWSGTLGNNNSSIGEYGFLNIEYDKAVDLFTKLEKVLKFKTSILDKGKNWNAVFRWEDLYFVFYYENSANKIRVFWNGFDSEWNQSNLKTTAKRFNKSFE